MTRLERQAYIFRFISLGFSYPDQAFIDELKKVSRKINGNAEAFTSLAESFGRAEDKMLQAEYTRLFINGYPHTPCPPYESVYREKRMLGHTAVSVQEQYMEWGMTVDTGLTDHIATEFEFLSFLSMAAALDNAASAAIDASGRFIEEHILRWVPQFAMDLEKNADLKVYRKLACLVRESLSHLEKPPDRT